MLLLVATAMTAEAAYGHDVAVKAEVREAVNRFLRAFENLDMQHFIACFAEDATVFFPEPEPARRFDGKAAIKTHFEQVFAAIRLDSASSEPPFHRLVPENLQVELLGDEGAVVTFQMTNAIRIARRTLVLQKRGDSWLISHLHASNAPVPAASPAP
jgi:ketosteroid isomerase-like protein